MVKLTMEMKLRQGLGINRERYSLRQRRIAPNQVSP